jgi:hypothetical protein
VDDPRLPFADAVAQFRAFLATQGWPTELAWVTRSDLAAARHRVWVFRPAILQGEATAAAFYEAARRAGPSSLRLDALGELEGRTIAYVEDYGGDGRHLDFGVRTAPPALEPVRSPGYWVLLRLATRLAGEAPWLRYTRLPTRAAI